MKKTISTFCGTAFSGIVYLASFSMVSSLLVLLMAGAVTPGCSSYSHSRVVDPVTGKVTEKNHLMAPFLTQTMIQGLKSETMDNFGTNQYRRTLGLDASGNRVDSEGVSALNQLIGNAVMTSLKTAAPIPIPK